MYIIIYVIIYIIIYIYIMPKISHDIPLYFALSLCIPILLVEPPIFSQFQTSQLHI